MDQKFRSLVDSIVSHEELQYAVLSSPKDKNEAQKVTVRPLLVKNAIHYQFSYYYSQKVIHENYHSKQCLEAILKVLPNYKQALICTSENDFQVLINKKEIATILKKPPTKGSLKMVSHNRQKKYCLTEGTAIPFLIELGVMSPSGKVHAQKHDKFRQINRFLEMVEDVISHLPKERILQIVDFGCGKAYLTFALYHYLHIVLGYNLHIIGLDLKADVVAYCQSVADKLKFTNLKFLQGDINAYSTNETIDLMVCLHACDIATDAALEKAVKWGTKIIMAVPCCQHELYNQVTSDLLDPLLKHGILKERFAALATDAARAQLLEIVGYKVQLLEFIDLEHTPKNLLIRAILLKNSDKRQKLLESYNTFKKTLQIKPNLEDRLASYLN